MFLSFPDSLTKEPKINSVGLISAYIKEWEQSSL